MTKTKFEAMEILNKYDIPCGPILSMKEIAEEPSLRKTGTIVEVDHPVRGKYLTVGNPIKLSDSPTEVTRSPLLGEHTDEVMAELGYTPSRSAHCARPARSERAVNVQSAFERSCQVRRERRMDTWMRFMSNDGGIVFGRVEGGYLHEYESLEQPVPTGAVLSTRALTLLAPCAPGKVVALWNNYHALSAKLDKPVPRASALSVEAGGVGDRVG